MHLYLMVGVSVGLGRAGREKVGRTNANRGKDLVPNLNIGESHPRHLFSALSHQNEVHTFAVSNWIYLST